jgi:hypothetical protein
MQLLVQHVLLCHASQLSQQQTLPLPGKRSKHLVQFTCCRTNTSEFESMLRMTSIRPVPAYCIRNQLLQRCVSIYASTQLTTLGLVVSSLLQSVALQELTGSRPPEGDRCS